MNLLNTKIKGPKLIKTTIHKDSRGFLKEVYRSNVLKKVNFIFDVMSISKKNVLRGLHLQIKKPQAKIITVTSGKIFDVAVDLRKKSKTFGKFVSVIISERDNFSFYIPKGFAHGFLCLSDKCTVYYKNSDYLNPKDGATLNWNDKSVNIKWPVKKPILSKKDSKGECLDYFSK
tara:strand:+ start:3126 stop:3647 length:522 start_codon:yes stop_codon:yes gene_type:complete